jgi:hypothetical protein
VCVMGKGNIELMFFYFVNLFKCYLFLSRPAPQIDFCLISQIATLIYGICVLFAFYFLLTFLPLFILLHEHVFLLQAFCQDNSTEIGTCVYASIYKPAILIASRIYARSLCLMIAVMLPPALYFRVLVGSGRYPLVLK